MIYFHIDNQHRSYHETSQKLFGDQAAIVVSSNFFVGIVKYCFIIA